MNEKIIPFSYRRLADKRRAYPLFFMLLAIGAALVIASMYITKYAGVVSLVAIGMLTASVMVYIRYIVSDYTYSVREGEDNQACLIFTKIVGKRQSMMGYVPLYAIKSIEKFTKSDIKKEKVGREYHRYNFVPTFSPDEVYVIKAEVGAAKHYILIEGTEELSARLLEYAAYALCDKLSYDEEE